MKVRNMLEMVKNVNIIINQDVGCWPGICKTGYEGEIEEFNELEIVIVYDGKRSKKYNSISSIDKEVMDSEGKLTEINIFSENDETFGVEDLYSYIRNDSCTLTIELIK